MFSELAAKIRLRWLRRNEHDSLPLRQMFAERWRIEIGMYSYGCFDPWRISSHTRIGRYCSFAKTARVIDANHPISALSTHPFLYEPRFGLSDRRLPEPDWLVIEDDVWVSHNATIMPGCKFIGRGAIIGAGAIVNHDVPRYTIAAGMPARALRQRFDPETIVAVEATRWWELDKAALAKLIAANPDSVYHPNPANLTAITAS